MTASNRRLDIILAFGLAALILLPWYRIEGGVFGFGWMAGFPGEVSSAPGLMHILLHGRWWLAIAVLALLLGGVARLFALDPPRRGALLAAAGGFGIVFLALQGLAIGFTGWSWTIGETLFGPLADGQLAMGAGAVSLGTVFVLMLSFGLAERGVMKGDAFVVAAIATLVTLVAIFVFYPIVSMFVGSLQDFDGAFNPDGFIANIQPQLKKDSTRPDMIQHFIDCIRDPEKKLLTDGRDGLVLQAMLDAVEDSAKTNREVPVTIPEVVAD